MADLNAIAHRLEGTDLGLTGVETRAPREVRLTVQREKIPALADYLRDYLGARPELIAAEEAREGGFLLRYVFEIEDADIFVVASSPVPARPGVPVSGDALVSGQPV